MSALRRSTSSNTSPWARSLTADSVGKISIWKNDHCKIFKEVEVRLRLRWYKTGKNYNFAKEELRIAGGGDGVDGDWRCVEVRVAAEAGSIRSQDCDHSNL